MGSGFHSFWLSAFPGDGRQGPSLSPPVPSSTLTKIFEEDGGGLGGRGNFLDSVYTSYAKTFSQRAIQRTCTAAANAETVLAYRVAIPRQRLR